MEKQRIAILGGGMGSLTTAFELTNQPGWSDRYDITVYQTGWRLGGKCASGRNRDAYQRIEEHGLHVMFGFYDNVFRIMKQAYGELGRAPNQPLATWQDAFKPHDLIVMMEQQGNEFVPWEVCPPRNEREVGGTTGHDARTSFDYLLLLLEHSRRRYDSNIDSLLSEAASVIAKTIEALLGLASAGRHDLVHEIAQRCEAVAEGTARLGADAFHEATRTGDPLLKPILALLADVEHSVGYELVFLHLAHLLARTSPTQTKVTELDPGEAKLIPWLLRKFLHRLHARLDGASRDMRRLFIELDFMLTIAIGLIADDMIDETNWFKIDDEDFAAWLSKHGAFEVTLESPMVSGLYDAIFSTGDQVAAGTLTHLFLLMAFEYKGSVLYKMQAGMGDTVFTPLYQVLERRGVKFEFFHTVNRLALSSDGTRIQRVEIGVQATLKEGRATYDPFVEVKGLACWPSKPHFDQLVQGEQLEAQGIDLENFWSGWEDVASKTLEAGRDFDTCVLGISIGAFPFICKELIDRDPRWQRMIEGVSTCQTAALQLWFSASLEQTGWKTRSHELPIVIPYVEPLDTWSCMNQLIDKEEWPAEYKVGSLHYLCSSMADQEPVPPARDRGYPGRQAKRLAELCRHWLETNVRGLWPLATQTDMPNALNWWWLVDPHNGTGVDRLHSQYWHAVTSPAERYVLSAVRNTSVRLRPDDSGFANLVLTGDWTLNALSAGCLEATAMSGIMAANAVDGVERPIAYNWLPPTGAAARPPAAAPTEPPAHAPLYIARDGVLMATPPVTMDTTLYMFLLDADMDALRKLCDTYLNLGGKTVYRPIVPWVCLYCSQADSAPEDDPIGWCMEKDFGFWVPVLAGHIEGSLFVADKLLMFTPYLWVDSGVAMTGGREVYGFPKQLGTLTMPDQLSKTPHFTVDTLVIPRYAPTARVIEKRILDIHRKDSSIWDKLTQLWNDGATIVKAVEELLAQHGPGRFTVPDAKLLMQLLSGFKREMPMVFLKEFPSAAADGTACYQAVVEAPVTITSTVTGGWIPGTYEIDLWSYDSHQIAKNLGLRGEHDGNRTRLSPLAHGWAKFDGCVQGGTVVYERGPKRS